MKNISVKMDLETLENIPDASLPDKYAFRDYTTGNIDNWVSLYSAAEIFQTITADTFIKAFHEDEDALRKRMFFIVDQKGAFIGTSTAWYDDISKDPEWGRVHWVAIHPDAQGLGLSKPLLTETLKRLKRWGHNKAYLFTSTGRIPALSLYIKYGFKPDVHSDEERQAWREAITHLPEKYAIKIKHIIT